MQNTKLVDFTTNILSEISKFIFENNFPVRLQDAVILTIIKKTMYSVRGRELQALIPKEDYKPKKITDEQAATNALF